MGSGAISTVIRNLLTFSQTDLSQVPVIHFPYFSNDSCSGCANIPNSARRSSMVTCICIPRLDRHPWWTSNLVIFGNEAFDARVWASDSIETSVQLTKGDRCGPLHSSPGNKLPVYPPQALIQFFPGGKGVADAIPHAGPELLIHHKPHITPAQFARLDLIHPLLALLLHSS
jgi:hypothetical protein